MKSGKRFFKITGFALFVFVMFISGAAWATPLTVGGIPIIAIDGDGDGDVFVNITTLAFVPPTYTYGYFLNGSTVFTPLAPINTTAFTGGDVIDFALFDGTNHYRLSGDSADSNYAVEMVFISPVTLGSPQQPADWSNPYYSSVTMAWSLPTTVVTTEYSFNVGGNDGIAPVPEPATLVLLGSGLAGIGLWKRKRSNIADK